MFSMAFYITVITVAALAFAGFARNSKFKLGLAALPGDGGAVATLAHAAAGVTYCECVAGRVPLDLAGAARALLRSGSGVAAAGG